MDDNATFLEFSPSMLDPWVEDIWYSSGVLESRRERVLPSATTDIVANLGAPMRLVDGAGVETIRGTTVTGLLTRPLTLEHPQFHEALGIRLTALGLRAVLGIPAGAVRDLVVDLEDVVEAATDELANRCLAVKQPQRRLAAAVEWLVERIERFGDTADPLAAWASSCIDENRGNIAISTLQERSGYGATRFHRRFVDEFGVTPKDYARLVRFGAALDLLDSAVPLTHVALSLGYSDQPHMNRDFRTLGQTTPTEVLRSRYPSGITLAVE